MPACTARVCSDNPMTNRAMEINSAKPIVIVNIMFEYKKESPDGNTIKRKYIKVIKEIQKKNARNNPIMIDDVYSKCTTHLAPSILQFKYYFFI